MFRAITAANAFTDCSVQFYRCGARADRPFVPSLHFVEGETFALVDGTIQRKMRTAVSEALVPYSITVSRGLLRIGRDSVRRLLNDGIQAEYLYQILTSADYLQQLNKKLIRAPLACLVQAQGKHFFVEITSENGRLILRSPRRTSFGKGTYFLRLGRQSCPG